MGVELGLSFLIAALVGAVTIYVALLGEHDIDHGNR